MDERSAMSSKLRIITDPETLYSYQVANERLDALVKILLRGYEGLWSTDVSIQESRIAQSLKWDEQEVINQLIRLNAVGLVDYWRPSTKSQITLLRERIPEKNFTIDQKAYEFRKDRAQVRMESMLQYLKDEVPCRESFILQYFGEETDTRCGHCDRCLQEKKTTTGWTAAIYNALENQEGITVKDFLASYQLQHQSSVREELFHLVDENKIKIVEDRIYKLVP